MRREEFEGCAASPGPSSVSIFAGAAAVVFAILAACVVAARLNGVI